MGDKGIDWIFPVMKASRQVKTLTPTTINDEFTFEAAPLFIIIESPKQAPSHLVTEEEHNLVPQYA